MSKQGWKPLLAGAPWFRCGDCYPIEAYSEFMPPPRLGLKPYGRLDTLLFSDDDPYGWHVTEYEQAWELQPGMELLARELMKVLRHLGRRESAHGIAKAKLQDNAYWPAQLQETGAPRHEHYVALLPVALSRTQDDKGRVRWTLFGGSEQGPARAFWRGFFSGPRRELPADWGTEFFRRLLAAAYREKPEAVADLRRAGFRILAGEEDENFPFWREEPLPAWTADYRWNQGQSLRGVRYLLAFRPFGRLPKPVQRAYLAGDLHLLPFPGGLVFWGVPSYVRLQRELPLAMQIPLLHSIERHEAPRGIRVPQSGWMHEPHPGEPEFSRTRGPLRNYFQRTHRWARVHRHEDELAVTPAEDRVAHVLFSAAADQIGLYGKPMARNSQVWTRDFDLLLDGTHATREELVAATERVKAGGSFGYRFVYPAMRVGLHEVYWHRPLVAYWTCDGEPALLDDPPLGYLTAYRADRPRLDRPIELWPRLLQREPHRATIETFQSNHDHQYHVTALNARKLFDTWRLFDERPLSASFARQLLTLPRSESLDDWLASLPSKGADAHTAGQLSRQLRDCLDASDHDAAKTRKSKPRRVAPLTFGKTARRSFEAAYWKTIYRLAAGEYVNKDNADCVLDSATAARLKHHRRDLDALGSYLLEYYEKTFAACGMSGRAVAGELPFQWRTDFDFAWMGGWLNNQQEKAYERDIVAVIPGRDRKRAVIMADHYDTAYMEDVYGYQHGGHGPRLAAAGADDNHSATAALMLAAPILLDMSRAGRLACDVWLVHLTGEEFPADCMGARQLCQRLVEGDLALRLVNGRRRDLSPSRVQGVFVLDMVAHNNDRDRDVFQICPGASRESMWLAYQAHMANKQWNDLAPQWNRRAGRRGLKRGRRSADGKTMPAAALHPQLSGEVRPTYDPRSTLYNTDGQIFSDAGVPVVLFMENYDINRKGYHDTHDTMENIDLDYGAAVAAITIESVARAATEIPPWVRD